jgi:hypothetical protein
VPLETSKESVIKHSTSTPGLDDTRAQSFLLPIKMGEKRRIYDSTVVNIQHTVSEEVSSHDASVASTLSVPVPAASPVHPEQAELARQSLNESKPPIEVVSR